MAIAEYDAVPLDAATRIGLSATTTAARAVTDSHVLDNVLAQPTPFADKTRLRASYLLG